MSQKTFLITGAAGFIGAALVIKLLKSGENVIGIDNLNNYYDNNLKKARIKVAEKVSKEEKGIWKFFKIDLVDDASLHRLFVKYNPQVVINLAAQAGVRYSIKNPKAYAQSNLLGFTNILEECRFGGVESLIYASSSSVYGGNLNLPFSENHKVDYPISFYAATKKANELMAHSYSHLYKIPITGLRFFTVYGPWGRPDMAPMIFAKAIFKKEPIDIYNNGEMSRDFTFIDDVVEGIFRCCYKPADVEENNDLKKEDKIYYSAPHRIFNIGNSNPTNLMEFINTLENEIGIKVIKNFMEMQPGDLISTNADTSRIEKWVNFKPQISLKEGIRLFVKWYKEYYLNS